jgi:hypothetical protein
MTGHRLTALQTFSGDWNAFCECGWAFSLAKSLNEIEDAHALHLRVVAKP